jgi:hypothetical protein
MSKIFVSYRRSDSQATAGRIVDRLISKFGEQSVFMDVDNIPFGIDFRDHIQSALTGANVLIAIVGPDWLGADPHDHRRIDDEDDPIRLEIETALRQKLRIIPVLVNDASMPKANVLPESLRDFSFLNAAPVGLGVDFRLHIDRLIRSIESVLDANEAAPTGLPASGPVQAGAGSPRSKRTPALVTAGAVVLLLAAGAAWRFGPGAARNGVPSPTTTSSPPAIRTAEPSDPVDDSDWRTAQSAGSYVAYRAYAKNHPNGQHLADARAAAVSGALHAEPPIGALPTGETVLVDDHDCAANQIKAVTGGNVIEHVSRTRVCVSRDRPF